MAGLLKSPAISVGTIPNHDFVMMVPPFLIPSTAHLKNGIREMMAYRPYPKRNPAARLKM
jgi:hypothetical protein